LSGLKIWCVMRRTYLFRHGYNLLSKFFLHRRESCLVFSTFLLVEHTTILDDKYGGHYLVVQLKSIFFLAWMEQVPL
jgi:hypothetical protein